MKKKLCVLAVMAVLAVMTSSVTAGMWWQRGDPGSTWQDWTFDTGANPTPPEAYSNPGIPLASIVALPGPHVPIPGWKASYLGRPGVWAGDPLRITLDIPNFPPPNPFKEIWLVVEYYGVITVAGITEPQVGVQLLEQSSVVLEDGWKVFTIGWRIEPNPVREQIVLDIVNSGAYLNYLTVDTLCYIPEPATLAILAIGGLLLRRKK